MKRPIPVTLLALVVIAFTAWNCLRLGEAIHFWNVLIEYGTHPLYTAVSGGVWLAAGTLLTLGLWRGKAWAWIGALVGTAAYGFWYWIDKLIVEQPHANWPFAIEASAAFLVIVLLILFTPPARRYFQRDPHE
jgi:hypothetical protein